MPNWTITHTRSITVEAGNMLEAMEAASVAAPLDWKTLALHADPDVPASGDEPRKAD